MSKAKGSKTPAGKLRRADAAFHLKLKHVLGGISLLSLLAAFEVFSIPAASGIIELFILTKLPAAEVWFGTAALTGFAALYLHREEQENDI
jgi:hypothetical protein